MGTKRGLALVLCVLLVISLAACQKTEQPVEQTEARDTLLVGSAVFSGQFSPFYARTDADESVCDMVGVSLLENDRGGSIVMHGAQGDTVAYHGTEYTYQGIADCEIETKEDGTVVYTLRLRPDVCFSDGRPLGVKDVLFSMYVLADPTYDGASAFSSLPIVGMEEYRQGMSTLADLIAAAGEQNDDFSLWSEEQQTLYWQTLKDEAGIAFVQEIIDYCIADGHAEDVEGAIEAWGYGDQLIAGKTYTAEDFFDILCQQYKEQYAEFSSKESAGTSLFDHTKRLVCEKDPAYGIGVVTDQSAPTISGIEKVSDDTLTVTMSAFDAGAVYTLAIGVAPMHYYGQEELYDEAQGNFGFHKGDLTHVKSVTAAPLGAGPYRFVSYDGMTLNFEANEYYYKGAPKIAKVSFLQTSGDVHAVDNIANGVFDICAPSLTNAMLDQVREKNRGELDGSVIAYRPVDFNGYGYIGINAKNVSVGGQAQSDASKNLRKAFATLFAVYREQKVREYYGDLAEVIEYPISAISWAAPAPGDEGYTAAYTYDANGQPIYDDAMNAEQRYTAALFAAKEYLISAGYTWDSTQEIFTDAPEGAKLSYTIIIPGEGKGDHPVYGIAQAAAEALESLGITLEIQDPADTNQLWNALNSGSAEIWAAAWSGTLDPDLYPVYYSENYPTGETGTKRNYFYIADTALDRQIMDARTRDNITYRRTLYMDSLNIILDWGVEIPVYQRQEAYLFSAERLKLDTLPQDMTPYRTWLSEIERLELA